MDENAELKDKIKELQIQLKHERKSRQIEIDECLGKIEKLRKSLEIERKDRAKLVQEELRKRTEKLVKAMEALKEVNEGLSDETKKLENEKKLLEELNKRQLLHMTDASNIPQPLRLDSEALKLKSLKDVERIQQIRDKAMRSSICSSSASPSSSSTRLIPNRLKPQDTEEESAVLLDSVNKIDSNCLRDEQKIDVVDKLIEQLNQDDFIEGAGILKRSDTLTSVDIAERTIKKQVQMQKHVRLSLRFDSARSSVVVEPEPQKIETKSKSEETFGQFLKRSSRNSSILSATSRIPSILLDTLNDRKLLNKYTKFTIQIEIISLELAPDSSLLSTDKERFIYIEYSFLGFKGHLMETQSLPQPRSPSEPVFYRFTQWFDINAVENEDTFYMLSSMVAKNSTDSIKFMVVSEPIEDEDSECEEIGFCLVKLNELIRNTTNDPETMKAGVFSTSYPNELIAFLEIKVTGIKFLQDLATNN